MKKYQIAIDGPASSGKSTIAQIISDKLRFTYIDTGAMYRGVTYGLMENNIDFKDEEAIKQWLLQMNFEFFMVNNQQHLFINSQDVSQEIRTPEVTKNVSEVSAIDYVRKDLVKKQQELAKKVSVVMDGRDIGTVVLKNADFKFFFVASADVRAQRRYEENIKKGMFSQSLEEIKSAILSRDQYDSSREHSPLKKADDAIEIDTSNLSIDEVTDLILKIVVEKVPSLKNLTN